VDGVTFASAEVGQGFVISGSGDDYVALPQNVFPFPASGTSTNPLSFEVWFKTSNGGVVLGQQDHVPFTSASGWVPALYVGTNGFIYGHFFEGAGTPPFLSNSVPVNNGVFHHAAVTYDGTTEILYVDGVAAGSMPFTQQAYGEGNYQYQLGTGYTAGWPGTTGDWFPFDGIIDEASVYDRALGADEVAAIFNAGSAGKCLPAVVGPAVLRHRYSFNDAAGSRTVTDSIGSANGTLVFASTNAPYTNGLPDGSGFTGAGLLNLKGSNGCVGLPAGLVSQLSSVTFEAWVIWNGPSAVGWQRIFDFGSNDQGTNASGTGTNYLILTPSTGDSRVLSFQETTVNPHGGIEDPGAIILDGPSALPLAQETYVAVTYNPSADQALLYVNGALVGSLDANLNPLSNFADYNNWLGRSQWQVDPFYNGQFDEFRIWQGVLTGQQIANHFSGGPNQQLAISQPALSIARSAGNVLLSWPTNSGANFRLQSTRSLAPANWLTVTNGPTATNGQYSIAVPASPGAAFYRLAQ